MLVHSLYLNKEGACACVPGDLRQAGEPPTHHATQWEKVGKEERGKRSRHKHGNQRDMRQEVRIKEQEERREGISSLIFLLSPVCTFQSSLV